ncbi:uncharacterized protein LOC126833372 [Adelges cooleyi]|uniref:uncharacterized protein LOC126833372 n=1 Tax=Adelges cooleyi TaxID=133065 RepID=UPI0021800E7C|nr:uncharacterized protein LOC126833372 [Adelges cooleyi]
MKVVQTKTAAAQRVMEEDIVEITAVERAAGTVHRIPTTLKPDTLQVAMALVVVAAVQRVTMQKLIFLRVLVVVREAVEALEALEVVEVVEAVEALEALEAVEVMEAVEVVVPQAIPDQDL